MLALLRSSQEGIVAKTEIEKGTGDAELGNEELLLLEARLAIELSQVQPVYIQQNEFEAFVGGRLEDLMPGTIDQRAINSKKPLTPLQVKENLNMGLFSARAIGCNVEGINPADVGNGRAAEILKLACEILKVWLSIQIRLLIPLRTGPSPLQSEPEGSPLFVVPEEAR